MENCIDRRKFEIAMMKNLLTVTLLSASLACLGQTRINLNNDAWLVIDGGAAVVIDHSNPNGITTSGSGGNVSSEAEEDRIRWNIGNGTGTYTIPYTNNSGVKIPLTYFVAAAGSADGSVVFSTYNHENTPGANWNNDLYRPSNVTHMNNLLTLVNNSDNAVDRFWIIDPSDATYGYTTRPTPRLTFRYDPATDVVGGNAITSGSNVGAQRFNDGTNEWGDLLPLGVWAGGAVNTVNAVTLPSNADFFRSWTLASFSNPLPVELVRFNAECRGDFVSLEWATATESNNDFFSIEKSEDGLEWTSIGTVQGAGNSVQTIEYSFVDANPTTLAYYRLVQTDYDGTSETSNIIAGGCEGANGVQIVNAWDDGSTVTLVVSSSDLDNFDLTLIDVQGKELLTRSSQVINSGITNLSFNKGHIATGVYTLRLHNGRDVLTRRIVLN